MRNQRALPLLGTIVGTAGLIFLLVDVVGLTYQWRFSPSVISSVLLFLLIGGPLTLVSLLTGSLQHVMAVDILLLICYLLGFVITLILARRLDKRVLRWAALAFFVPFIPSIVLSLKALQAKRQLPSIRPVTQPSARVSTPSKPVASGLDPAAIRRLVGSIVNSDSFGQEQIRSRDELRNHQDEQGVRDHFTAMLREETDIYRRIRIVRLLGQLPTAWARGLLIETASNDPYTSTADEFYPSSDPDVEERRSQTTIYPVREAAEKALKGSHT